MIRFYGLKNCDTCKKALKALEAAGNEITVCDVRADGVPETELASWLAELGSETLVNKRSTTWRGLSEADRAAASGENGALRLLLANPTLLKRPVTIADGTVRVGWSRAVQDELL